MKSVCPPPPSSSSFTVILSLSPFIQNPHISHLPQLFTQWCLFFPHPSVSYGPFHRLNTILFKKKKKMIEEGVKEGGDFLFPSQKNPHPVLAPPSLHESQRCIVCSSPSTVPLWSKQEDSRARTKGDSGGGRGGGEGRVHGKGVRKSRHFSPVVWKSNSLCGTMLQESWKAICSTGRLQHPNVAAWGWRYVSWARAGWGEGFLPIVVLLQYDGGYMTALCCGVLGKLDLTSGIVTFPNSCFWHARGCWKQYLPPIVAVPGGVWWISTVTRP